MGFSIPNSDNFQNFWYTVNSTLSSIFAKFRWSGDTTRKACPISEVIIANCFVRIPILCQLFEAYALVCWSSLFKHFFFILIRDYNRILCLKIMHIRVARGLIVLVDFHLWALFFISRLDTFMWCIKFETIIDFASVLVKLVIRPDLLLISINRFFIFVWFTLHRCLLLRLLPKTQNHRWLDFVPHVILNLLLGIWTAKIVIQIWVLS